MYYLLTFYHDSYKYANVCKVMKELTTDIHIVLSVSIRNEKRKSHVISCFSDLKDEMADIGPVTWKNGLP